MDYKIGDVVKIENNELKIINVLSADYKSPSPGFCDLYFIYVLKNIENDEIVSLLPWQFPENN